MFASWRRNGTAAHGGILGHARRYRCNGLGASTPRSTSTWRSFCASLCHSVRHDDGVLRARRHAVQQTEPRPRRRQRRAACLVDIGLTLTPFPTVPDALYTIIAYLDVLLWTKRIVFDVIAYNAVGHFQTHMVVGSPAAQTRLRQSTAWRPSTSRGVITH